MVLYVNDPQGASKNDVRASVRGGPGECGRYR